MLILKNICRQQKNDEKLPRMQIKSISLHYHYSGRAALQKRIMALLRKIDSSTPGTSQVNIFILLNFSLTALIFISGCCSAISSAKQGKSGSIYNLVKR